MKTIGALISFIRGRLVNTSQSLSIVVGQAKGLNEEEGTVGGLHTGEEYAA